MTNLENCLTLFCCFAIAGLAAVVWAALRAAGQSDEQMGMK